MSILCLFVYKKYKKYILYCVYLRPTKCRFFYLYNKEDIITQAISVIEAKGIRKITHLIPELPIALSTFYHWELEKSEAILQKIYNERIKRKVRMLDKWEGSGNPALEIAAYKLLADDDELDILSTSKVKQDVTGTTTQIVKFVDDPRDAEIS